MQHCKQGCGGVSKVNGGRAGWSVYFNWFVPLVPNRVVVGSNPSWAGFQCVNNLTCYCIWGRDIKWGRGLRGAWGWSYRDGKEPSLASIQRSPLVFPHSIDLTRRQFGWTTNACGTNKFTALHRLQHWAVYSSGSWNGIGMNRSIKPR